MPEGKYHNFNIGKLWNAMEDKRDSKGFTKKQMMDDLNAVNNQVIPMSLETVTGMVGRNNTTCQHALHMCRWLDRTPESFLDGVHITEPLPFPVNGRLYWSMPALAKAVKDRKESQELTWKQLAQELNCSQSQVSGLHRITYGVSIHLAMRITQWLEQPSINYIVLI